MIYKFKTQRTPDGALYVEVMDKHPLGCITKDMSEEDILHMLQKAYELGEIRGSKDKAKSVRKILGV